MGAKATTSDFAGGTLSQQAHYPKTPTRRRPAPTGKRACFVDACWYVASVMCKVCRRRENRTRFWTETLNDRLGPSTVHVEAVHQSSPDVVRRLEAEGPRRNRFQFPLFLPPATSIRAIIILAFRRPGRLLYREHRFSSSSALSILGVGFGLTWSGILVRVLLAGGSKGESRKTIRGFGKT